MRDLTSPPAEGVAQLARPSADANPGEKDWKRTGAGLLAGLGYALGSRGGRPRTLDAGLDFAWQWYGRSTREPERSFSTVLRFGAAFH